MDNVEGILEKKNNEKSINSSFRDVEHPAASLGVRCSNMVRVLITTVYSMDSIVKAVTKLSVECIYLLTTKKTDDEQQETVRKIKESYGNVMEITEKKIEEFDIVSIAETVTSLIDDISNKNEIYINITPARKTQALGVIFAAYKRNIRVKKILYMIEDTNELISLPLLSFDVSESQQDILNHIEKFDNMTKLADENDVSRAMLYRNIKSLKDKGLIEDSGDGMKLTDAGKIARL